MPGRKETDRDSGERNRDYSRGSRTEVTVIIIVDINVVGTVTMEVDVDVSVDVSVAVSVTISVLQLPVSALPKYQSQRSNRLHRRRLHGYAE